MEQNPQLTTGSSAVYQRFNSGTRSDLSSWLLTSGTTPICLCKPFSCKTCLGIRELSVQFHINTYIYTCRIQNPDTPQAGRYGAAHGGTAGPGGDGQHRTPTTGLFAQGKTNYLTP